MPGRLHLRGRPQALINPFECIDCGACEPAWPVEAITEDRNVEDGSDAFVDDNAAFFTAVLPGRDEPVGEQPGGSSGIGGLGADTPLVASYPRRG